MKGALNIYYVLSFAVILASCNSIFEQHKNSSHIKKNSSLSVSAPKIILKLDDYGANTFNVVPLDYLISKNVKAGLGIIAGKLNSNSLTVYGKYINAKNSDGENLFELWHHGLDHSKTNLPNNNPEFKGTSPEFQKEHFKTADNLVLQHLNIQMRSFGAPYNANDTYTHVVLGENDAYKVVMFSNPQSTTMMNLNNRINMEDGTGNVDYNYFSANYNAKKGSYSYMVLQGHPNQWDAAKVAQFKQIIDFLIIQGCEFVLPYEYYLTNGSPKINVYQNCNFSGWNIQLGIGTYTMSQLATLGVANDQISSVKIPEGMKVIVYKNNNYGGDSTALTTNLGCLSNIGFNDNISSIKISLN